MHSYQSLFTTFICMVSSSVGAAPPTDRRAQQTCAGISTRISAGSAILNSSDADFASRLEHWVESYEQLPACVVDVGSPEDLSAVMSLVGETRTPFAVKGGGHMLVPGASSTTGVQISMARMKQNVFSPDNSTLEVGMGQTWGEVYAALEGSGYMVLGARVAPVGAGGMTLGGGFSWQTSRYGLAIDRVKQFNLVLPNGTITTASAENNPDLFFALKGGGNQFGVLTSVEYYTIPQPPQVFAGIITYNFSDKAVLAAVSNATVNFADNNSDNNAQLWTQIVAAPGAPITGLVVLHYHGADPGNAFAAFDSIPNLGSTVGLQNFSAFVDSVLPPGPAALPRGYTSSLSTSGYTMSFVEAVLDEAKNATSLAAGRNMTVSLTVEVLSKYGANTSNDESAYPHSRSPLPFLGSILYDNPEDDDYWYQLLIESNKRLNDVAKGDGIYEEIQYLNNALEGVSPEQLWGSNVPRLRAVRNEIDPLRIMDLTGGFRVGGKG